MSYNGILRKINKFLTENSFYLNDLNKLKAIVFDLSENDNTIIEDFKHILDARIIDGILNGNINYLELETISYDIFYNKLQLRDELSKRLTHFVMTIFDVNLINSYKRYLLDCYDDNRVMLMI